MSKSKVLAFLCIMLVAVSTPVTAGIYDDILSAANMDNTAGVINLLQRGMDVNTADASGNTLAMIAARNGNADLLGFLLKNNANILKRNRYGDTAIMLAVVKGRIEIVRQLLDANTEINNTGWNPLHYAAYGGHAEIVRLLVAKGADLDVQAPNGQTALMLAANADHLETVKILIDADADMDAEDYQGNTAIMLAEKAGFTAIVDYLRSEGAYEE